MTLARFDTTRPYKMNVAQDEVKVLGVVTF